MFIVEWLEDSDKQRERGKERKKKLHTVSKSPSREARMWRALNFPEGGVESVGASHYHSQNHSSLPCYRR